MSEQATQILERALRLPPTDRAEVVEKLLCSLDRPDAHLDETWAEEVEARISAYEAGQIQAFEADDVFAELDHQ